MSTCCAGRATPALQERMCRSFFAILLMLSLTATPARAASGGPRTDSAGGGVSKSAAAAASKELIYIRPSPLVTRLLKDPTTSEADKRRLALFHGRWEGLIDLSPAETAFMAMQRCDWANPVFANPAVAPLLRAAAALEAGDPAQAQSLLANETSAQAAVIRAQALEQMGQVPAAIDVLAPWREGGHKPASDDAAELTAEAQAVTILARLEGQPARDYQLAIRMMGKARTTLDQLYWPADVAESHLLAEKDNPSDAADAAADALKFNPKSSEAWYLLGQLGLASYNFDLANVAISQLRKINPDNVLADSLVVETALTLKDPATARTALASALSRFPHRRELMALRAATEAVAYNEKGLRQALQESRRDLPSLSAGALYRGSLPGHGAAVPGRRGHAPAGHPAPT